ncbi:MAG: addiction module toxin RelE [Candidatus Latescibacteria bacterium]|nr:addiction module toxin RelE [Candidatus Latescibacterota bacterium]MBT5831446.1 addiction module toxin RelE [Candidatus Latescibacterota bacterium]
MWIGPSFRDLRDFPREVQKDIGYALWVAQMGEKHDYAKPLKGFSGVMEIVSQFKTDAYRAVYAIKLGDTIYVLHAFQKKSTRGIATPQKEMDVLRKRFLEARRLAQEK